MNKSVKRSGGFYIFIALTVILLWTAGLATALYIRGKQLTTAAPLLDRQRSADTETRRGEAVPALDVLLPCAQYVPEPPAVAARSAVIIDAESGGLLFAKNPDQSIPPASLTKLVAIYTAMQAIENGEISLTDCFSPPPESWAVNIPPGSSLMFLGKDQKVTVEELIRGMSVVSGNDAAIALAIHTAGSVSAFAGRMNKAMEDLGLANTHFEEPSGLSEHNRTTARDFARFSSVYLKKYPEHLQRFHAVRALAYPQPHNTLTGQTAIRQNATNTLLTKLEGCDGIKTGFIYESGFNIALTAQRNGVRFIAVILGGAGKTSKQGKQIREYNGKVLMEWAFSHFSTAYAEDFPVDIPAVPVLGRKRGGETGAVRALLPRYGNGKTAFTVAQNNGETNSGTHTIRSRVLLPVYLSAPVAAGEKIGKLQFIAVADGKEYITAEFSLLADRGAEKGYSICWRYDNLALRLYRRIHRLFSPIS